VLYHHNHDATVIVKEAFGSESLASQEILAQETDRFLRLNVLQTTDDERGQLAICAAIYNEGRFISEWLIYVSLNLFNSQAFFFLKQFISAAGFRID
jgi:hypothetical protein